MFRDMIQMSKLVVTDINGNEYETEGQIQNDKIFIYDKNAIIDTGYLISYTLPNGLQKKTKVIKPGYYGNVTIGHGFPIYQCTVKDINLLEEKSMNSLTIGTLNNYGNNQIGNNNIQNIETAFTQIIEKIENAEASEQEKTEAKNKLKAFLEHPLVNTLIGGICGVLTTKLG